MISIPVSSAAFPPGTHHKVEVIAKMAVKPMASIRELEDYERKLIDETMPVLRTSLGPDNPLLSDKAKMIFFAFADKITLRYRAHLTAAKELHDLNAKSFIALEKHAEAQAIQLQQAQADARAAAEGRGIHESKKIAELTAAMEAKQRELAAAQELSNRLATEVGKLKNELTGRAVVVAAHEREKSELVGAAALTASKMQTAAARLGEAVANIRERYNDSNPFMNAILADLDAALAELPEPSKK